MATEKSIKPANLVPRSFGGEKNNFSDDLIANGYEVNMPQTYNGDNLNYQLDATGKELDYCEKVVDYINGFIIHNDIFITVEFTDSPSYKFIDIIFT